MDEREVFVLPLGAHIVWWLTWQQNDVVSFFSGRLAQRIRCHRITGHFHKWYLGDGLTCPWCRLVRRFPIAAQVIPYAPGEGIEWNDEDRMVRLYEDLYGSREWLRERSSRG